MKRVRLVHIFPPLKELHWLRSGAMRRICRCKEGRKGVPGWKR